MLNSVERDANEHLVDCLRRFVGRGGVPVKSIAEQTSLNERLIRSHLDHAVRTHLKDWMIAEYCRVLGPDFTNAWLSYFGQGGAATLGDTDVCAMSLLAESAHVQGRLADAAADLHFDHQERRMLPGPLRRLGRRCFELASGLVRNKARVSKHA